MTTIDEEITALKEKACYFMSQRRKDIDLYQVLADCMEICERAELDGETKRLKAEFLERERAKGKRAYFEKNADVYLIVGRSVFEPEVKREASWRYTATMREAAKRQIGSAELVDWLRREGGINALFKSRPVVSRSVTTKVLNLTSSIPVPKDREFTLVLKRNERGFYDVVNREDME